MVNKLDSVRVLLIIVFGMSVIMGLVDTYGKYMKYGMSYTKTETINNEEVITAEVHLISQIISLTFLTGIVAITAYDMFLFRSGYFATMLDVNVKPKGKEPESWSVDIIKDENIMLVHINEYILEVPLSLMSQPTESLT